MLFLHHRTGPATGVGASGLFPACPQSLPRSPFPLCSQETEQLGVHLSFMLPAPCVSSYCFCELVTVLKVTRQMN